MKKFKNKVILITGAAGDIGKVLVQNFLDEGGKVIATDTNNKQLDGLKLNMVLII